MANESPGAAVRLAEDTRSARKHKAILAAATEVFYHKGYTGTSMDEVAARAAVSKQTVYKHFADKERLFAEIVLRAVDEIDDLFTESALTLHDTDNLDGDLRALGRQFVFWLMQPDVLRLRRLIISEANRFPELSRTWYERGFQRVISTLATALAHLAERGLLRVDDPVISASQFMGMILWIPVNRAMFCGDSERFTPGELERYADTGVRAFLAAHRHP
ncbi:MAG TPA: TetR/AcrR family transcriptional regulator [Streptosporangiaceae bacterium]|jgi:AcrR family transcriptional regulator